MRSLLLSHFSTPNNSLPNEKTRASPHAFPLTSGKEQGTLPKGLSLRDPPEQLLSWKEGLEGRRRCFSNFTQSNGLGGLVGGSAINFVFSVPGSVKSALAFK